MKKLLLACLFLCSTVYATSSVTSLGQSSTQLLFALTTDQTGTCTVAVSTQNVFGTGYVPVNDVNETYFSGSSQCVRGGNITAANPQLILIGRRRTEAAPSGIYYSRALGEETQYFAQFYVGKDTVTITAQTGNIPFGLAQYEGPSYPWPTISETIRNQEIIEPTTGLKMKNIYLPGDFNGAQNEIVNISTIQPSSNWTTVSNVIVDDTNDTTYTGSTQDVLFAQADIFAGRSVLYASHSEATFNTSVVSAQVTLNAWVGSFSVTGDRQVDVAISDNGTTPIGGTGWTTITLSSCASSCNGSTFRPVVGSTQPAMQFWATVSTPVPTGSYHISRRISTVNVSGSSVTYASSGYYFDRNWPAGTPITINGSTYTITSVQSSHILVLNKSAGNLTNATAYVTPFGVIVRKTNTATNVVHIQFISLSITAEGELGWPAGSNQDENAGCSVPNSSNVSICQFVSRMYQVDLNTGNAIFIGTPKPPNKSGTDGWTFSTSCAAVFDETDPNTFYCSGADPTATKVVIVKATLSGSFTSDVAPTVFQGSTLPDCSVVGAPCWTFSNLTPVSTSKDVTDQVLANDTICDRYAGNNYILYGTGGKYLELYAFRAQNRIGCVMAFDSTTGLYADSRSGNKYPVRWSVLHSYGRVNGTTPNYWVFDANDGLAEYDDTPSLSAAPGAGPYITHINSGAVSATPTACPANPGGTPIPGTPWPTGSLCLQFTVVGEPCDPSIDSVIETQDGGTNCGASASTSYFLTKAVPGDVACIVNGFINTGLTSGAPGCGFGGTPGEFGQTAELVRLLTKSGDGPGATWTVQRGYTTVGASDGTDPAYYSSFSSNAELVMVPSGCIWYKDENGGMCGNISGFWNIQTSSNIVPQGQIGQGHSDVRPGGFFSAIGPGGLTNGNFNTYNWSPGGLTDFSTLLNSNVNYTVASDVGFNNARGVGSTNPVDSHPNLPRNQAVPFAGDAHVFNGLNSNTTPTLVAGTLYKFTGGTIAYDGTRQYFSPKNLQTLVYTDGQISKDISGPGVLISTGLTDLNHHCIVQIAGECQAGSSKGDLYTNAYSQAQSCNYAGVGNGAGDSGDTCAFAPGANAFIINQVYLSSTSDLEGNTQRRLSYGLANPNWMYEFWNVRFTPDAKWLFFPVFYANEKENSIMIAKMPTTVLNSGANRQLFQNHAVKIGPGPDARIRFGYDEALKCTSRNDQCLTTPTPTAADPYMFLSEGASYQSCSTGCTINIPAIPGRVLYYAIERNGFGYGNINMAVIK